MTEVVRILRRYDDDARWGRGNGIFFQGAEGERNNSTNAPRPLPDEGTTQPRNQHMQVQATQKEPH